VARHETRLEEYIRECKTCQKNKITQIKPKLTTKMITNPDVVWEICALDILGSFCQIFCGKTYALIFQDEISKFTLAITIKQQDTPTIARVCVKENILKFGIPQMVLTDQGCNFMSEVFTNICKLL
jgi:hypothetical protein